MGLGFDSALCLRYSVLSLLILAFTSVSALVSSSVGGLSSGNGIVDLLYSSLSFKFMCVSLGIIYASGGGSGLVFFLPPLLLCCRVWLVCVLGSGSGSCSVSYSESDSG